MKATHTKTPPTFTPVTINITCETQEELDAMYMLTNHAFVADAIKEVTGQDFVTILGCVRKEVISAGASIRGFMEFDAILRSIFKARG